MYKIVPVHINEMAGMLICGERNLNQRTNSPVNPHLISWYSKHKTHKTWIKNGDLDLDYS